MKRFALVVLALVAMNFLSGCTSVESGNTGVRTTFTGEVKKQELPQGLYATVTSSVDHFSCKEITIPLDNMTPKAGDNLSMEDMDIEIYYTVLCDQVAEQYLKYSDRTAYDQNKGVYYAGYRVVESEGLNAAYDAVSDLDSLEVHKNRDVIKKRIKEQLQATIDGKEPGVYTITRVIIRNADTDASVEESIRIAVKKDKELEAARTQVLILEQQSLANDKLTKSLSPEILRSKYLDVLQIGMENGSVKFYNLGEEANVLVNTGE